MSTTSSHLEQKTSTPEKRKALAAAAGGGDNPAAKKPKSGAAQEEKEYNLNRETLIELVTSKCLEFQKVDKMYTVKYSDKIQTVWGTLINKGYHSAPIVSGDGHLMDFVDLVDVASYFLAVFGRPMIRGSTVTKLSKDMEKEKTTWGKMTVRQLKEFTRDLRVPKTVKECYSSYSVLSALEPLARQQGLHRVAVVESPTNRKLQNLITQTQAVNYVFDSLKHFGAKKTKKIENCAGVLKPDGVFAVEEDTMALYAFEHMLANNVSALCVVRKDGTMMGVLSLKDLKVLGAKWQHLERLYGDVAAMLREVAEHGAASKASPKSSPKSSPKAEGAEKGVMAEAVELKGVLSKWTIHKDDTLYKAVKQMHEKDVRHLFLVEQGMPVGVVAMKDVLLEVIS